MWLNGKESAGQCRRQVFDPWIRKMPWRSNWQPTPVFLPGKSHGQRSLVDYSPWGHKRVRHNLATKQQRNWNKCPVLSETKLKDSQKSHCLIKLFRKHLNRTAEWGWCWVKNKNLKTIIVFIITSHLFLIDIIEWLKWNKKNHTEGKRKTGARVNYKLRINCKDHKSFNEFWN